MHFHVSQWYAARSQRICDWLVFQCNQRRKSLFKCTLRMKHNANMRNRKSTFSNMSIWRAFPMGSKGSFSLPTERACILIWRTVRPLTGTIDQFQHFALLMFLYRVFRVLGLVHLPHRVWPHERPRGRSCFHKQWEWFSLQHLPSARRPKRWLTRNSDCPWHRIRWRRFRHFGSTDKGERRRGISRGISETKRR
jgi:hypothetical protein